VSNGDPLLPGDRVTLREMYTLVSSLRTELLAAVKELSSHLDVELAALGVERELHKREHDRDRDRRGSLVRWAVTSVVSGAGVAVAVYVATRS